MFRWRKTSGHGHPQQGENPMEAQTNRVRRQGNLVGWTIVDHLKGREFASAQQDDGPGGEAEKIPPMEGRVLISLGTCKRKEI